MNKNRKTFRLGNTIQVVRLGNTKNAKISVKNQKIVQTYTFSLKQLEYVKDCLDKDVKTNFKEFFSYDAENCFDCPFSSNSGTSKCYTHKFIQYSGFMMMLRSILVEFDTIEAIPNYNAAMGLEIAKLSIDRYVRFGSYGEPSMHPIELVEALANNSSSWTGYTHQYIRKPEYSKWLMASTHNKLQAKTASEKFGFRSFIAVKDNSGIEAVICPASKESKADSNCAACGLCSGMTGKGKKDVVIIEH